MNCPDCKAQLVSMWIETPEGDWCRAWACECKMDARRLAAMSVEERAPYLEAMASRAQPEEYVDLWAKGEDL